MNPIQVSPERLREVADRVEALADRLDERWGAFLDRTGALPQAFGDDDVSALIQVTYDSAESVADESIVSIANGLLFYADGLRTMADLYEESERQIVDETSRVRVDEVTL